jgi:endonuclease/exonuclease/phosphatase family metal-dependent hydrolase
MIRPSRSPGPARIKLASYNIRKGLGTDRVRNPLRILKVLAEMDADIVTLQEADRRFGSRAAVLSQVLLDHHSDYEAVPLDVQTDSMGWHGNAILVRKGLAVLHHDIIHIPCLEPRGVVTATIATSAGPITVFGMHLDLSGLWRGRQARAIAALAETARAAHPTVMMGDCNEWRERAGCFREFGRRFTILDCGPSFHSRRPVGRLDRIMHCERLQLAACGVHHTPLAATASDHLPVWAELRIAHTAPRSS